MKEGAAGQLRAYGYLPPSILARWQWPSVAIVYVESVNLTRLECRPQNCPWELSCKSADWEGRRFLNSGPEISGDREVETAQFKEVVGDLKHLSIYLHAVTQQMLRVFKR